MFNQRKAASKYRGILKNKIFPQIRKGLMHHSVAVRFYIVARQYNIIQSGETVVINDKLEVDVTRMIDEFEDFGIM